MLEVRNVTKTYDGRAVVHDVTFEVRPGEIFALLGPNGAGKTTLIRMITDILRPDRGEVLFDGSRVTDGKTRIAYLPEERGLYRRAVVLDVLQYYGRLKGLDGATAHRDAAALLERVGLSDWARKQVQSLSKGMQQKVQLCTALIADPQLLILDEPYSGLDPVNVQLLEELLEERRAQGVTIILSTHQMNKVEEHCDRALMINQGFMVLYGPVSDIRRQHADHAVILRAAEAPPGVAGVREIERVDGDWKLVLETEATPRGVLRALLDRGVDVESFAIATLPFEDIFVKVVNEGIGLDHGMSRETAEVTR